jgi:hypothetical protein
MVARILAHTPYDGSATPFTIGLKVLDLADWIEVDGALHRYLDEKERYWRGEREQVFVETEASRAAQREVLELLAAYLPERFPERFQLSGRTMEIGGKRSVDLTDPETPPLFTAARMVQEDLVIMEPAEDGWRLTAASLSFPSSWSLAEKFDRPMHAIHETVPGFQAGTRNAELIERMFSNLRPERPVWRLNWSIYPDADLHHPKSKVIGSDFVSEIRPDEAFIRVEKQTLRRLPETGAVLFTIRIYVDPLAALIQHGEGARLAAGLKQQLAAFTDSELDYKGLRPRRQALADALDRVAGMSKQHENTGARALS